MFKSYYFILSINHFRSIMSLRKKHSIGKHYVWSYYDFFLCVLYVISLIHYIIGFSIDFFINYLINLYVSIKSTTDTTDPSFHSYLKNISDKIIGVKLNNINITRMSEICRFLSFCTLWFEHDQCTNYVTLWRLFKCFPNGVFSISILFRKQNSKLLNVLNKPCFSNLHPANWDFTKTIQFKITSKVN